MENKPEPEALRKHDERGRYLYAIRDWMIRALHFVFPPMPDYSDVDRKTLPYRTDTELRAREEQLPWEKIYFLACDKDWAPYAWALALKLYKKKIDIHDLLLQDYVERCATGASLTELVAPDRPDNIGNEHVAAQKLHVVNNRGGPTIFREFTEQAVDRVTTDECAPCLVPYTMFITLPHLCAHGSNPTLVLYPHAPRADGVIGHVISRHHDGGAGIAPIKPDTDVIALLQKKCIWLIDDFNNTNETLSRMEALIPKNSRWPVVAGKSAMIKK